MIASGVPAKFSEPFAASAGGGYVTYPIPATATDPNTASLALGFPPATFASGGAPKGADFNGVLKMLSAWSQWTSAGGPIVYDAAFQTAIGGYPLGARLVQASDPTQLWVSTVDSNMSDPDTSGANWDAVVGVPATNSQAIAGSPANVVITPPTLQAAIAAAIAAAAPPAWKLPIATCLFAGSNVNGAQTIINQNNIASVTRSGTGNYSVAFTTAAANATYKIVAMAQPDPSHLGFISNQYSNTTNTTAGFALGVSGVDGSYHDPALMHLVVYP